jgi:hypothetical protein
MEKVTRNGAGVVAARLLDHDSCNWHRIAQHVLPFECDRAPRPGRSTCAQHSAELDLMLFEAGHSPRAAWAVYWSDGYRTMKRIEAGELAAYLLERQPDGLLEQSADRLSMELRVAGRLVAIVRRVESLK